MLQGTVDWPVDRRANGGESMVSTIRVLLVLGIAALAAACGAKSTPGPDPNTDTQASTITWTDGKPAIQISCGMPGGCETRALAMCNGNYSVLDMKNMPTRGDATVVRGTGTVVVRCT
jgi:hypothetical protein